VTSNSQKFVKNSLERFTSDLVAPHLEVNRDTLSARVLTTVPRDGVGLQINELLVVEYYSRKV
jgi:small subunit ribosomal protein S4